MRDVKYLANGQEVFLIQKLDSGKYLVEPIYDVDVVHTPDAWGEQYYTEPERPIVVDRVFDEPPIARRNELTRKAIEETEAALAKKRLVENEIAKLDRVLDERKKKYSKYEPLELLDDYINGKITHYVEINYLRPKIVEFKDARSEHDRDKLKLLVLYGKLKR